jgi:hypothetical protein
MARKLKSKNLLSTYPHKKKEMMRQEKMLSTYPHKKEEMMKMKHALNISKDIATKMN